MRETERANEQILVFHSRNFIIRVVVSTGWFCFFCCYFCLHFVICKYSLERRRNMIVIRICVGGYSQSSFSFPFLAFRLQKYHFFFWILLFFIFGKCFDAYMHKNDDRCAVVLVFLYPFFILCTTFTCSTDWTP